MTAEDFLSAPAVQENNSSAEAFLNAPPTAEAFLGSSPSLEHFDDHGALDKPDISGVRLTPYDRFVKESTAAYGTRSPEQIGASDFLAAVGDNPVQFAKSLPAIAGGALAIPGKAAYYQAADAISKLFGEPEYGGNIKALEQGKDVLPVDAFVAKAAQTNPNLAVTAKLGQAATEMAPSLGLAAAPAAVNRVLAAGFSAQMIASAPQLFQQYAEETSKPKDEQDAGKLADLKSQMIQTFLFAPLAGAGAVHGLDTLAVDKFVPRGAGIEGSKGVAPAPAPEPVQTPGTADTAPAASPAEAAAAIVPERPETVAAQMDWLNNGKRSAVLLTPGEEIPALPEGTELHPTDAGTFVYNPEKTSPEKIDEAVANNTVGDLLGYGISEKPAPEDVSGVVVIRDANGVEKQAVVTDQRHLDSVVRSAKQLAGEGDTVQVESPQQVLAGRKTPVPSEPVETPAARMAREQREAMAALRNQPEEIPLGLNRPEVVDPTLKALSETEFDQHFRTAKREVNEAEKMFDETPSEELTVQQKRQIAAAQDKWSAASLERYRRNAIDIDPRDLFRDLKNLAGRAVTYGEGSAQHAKAKILIAELKRQGATNAQILSDINLSSPDAAEVFKADLEDIRKLAGEPPVKPKLVQITAGDYKAARVGNNPFMEVQTATGLAKEMRRAQEFGEAALNERPGETEPMPVQQLFVGDRFKLNGQPAHVTDWVTDAETGQPAGVHVDGAFGRQYVPVEQTLHIDKGSLSDSVTSWLDKAIDATSLKGSQIMEGVTGAPVWMSKAAVNGALKIARFAYTKTRDISRSVGEAIRFLRSQKLSGYNEAEAMNWLESNLRGDPVTQSTGRTIGAATEDRRGILNTSPRQAETARNVSTLPFQRDLQSAVTGEGWRQRVGGWLGNAAGETFPRTTRVLRQLGEQGARWISSRQAATPLADAFVDDVTRGLGLDDVEFGAALHEDNLRSIKSDALKAQAAAQVAGDVAAVARIQKQLDAMFSFVGEGGFWKDEQAYQNYLQIPRVQEALRRHRGAWDELIEPMYKEAMKIDPSEELPSRGLQTGARINLNFVREGEPVGKDTFVGTPAPRGQLSNVLQRRSPFGRLAKGTAAAYKPSYLDAMRNTYARQLEIANRNKFDRMMVESGNAVIDKPGLQNKLRIKGEGVTPFEIKRTVVQTDGQRIPSFQNIYVRNSLAGEYRHALNLDPRFSIPVVTQLSKLSNGLALAGLTEVSAHLGNLAHALLWRPGVARNFWGEIALANLGRADALVSIVRALSKFTEQDRTRLRELAEIGALREPHPPGAKWNPLGWGSRVIEWADRHARVQMDRMFDNLAEQGLVPKTETARREFVNQMGQYNRRAQGQVMHWLRDTGVAPFVTAGRAFNVLALKTAALSPGIKTTSPASRLAVAATMAAKVNGTLLLIGTLNYLLTHNKGGGVLGRPGTPLGAVDLGVDDKNRRPLTLDVSNILGLKRVARVTGVRGLAESLRYDLPAGVALDSAMRDIQNAWLAPVTGPVARNISIAISGQAPGKGIPRVAPIVPPGKSQALQNLESAALEANQIVAGIHDAQQPGATGWEWLQKQAGRFTLQPGKPAQMVVPGRYARIVDRAQASEYIDDVIGRARKMQGVDRANYVRDAIMQLDPRDRQHALLTLEERGIIPHGLVQH